MSAPTKLFLEYNHIDNKWKILDKNDRPFGSGETPEDAIRSARVCTNAPIYANRDFGGLLDSVLDVPTKQSTDLTTDDVIYTKDELIEALAELGGFKISKVYGIYEEVLGYTMELIE